MPGFVKTKKDEKRWSEAKRAVSSSKKKDEGSFEDRDWALTNYIYHKMGKSDEDQKVAEELKKAFMGLPMPKTPKTPGAPPSPAKPTTSTAVKMPKSKKLPDATDKPSIFFKNEQNFEPKHTTLRNLKTFLDNTKRKRNLDRV